MPASLADIVITMPEQKSAWAALRGSLTHFKASLTRKLNEELELAENLKPTVQSGPELRIQYVTYNSYYGLFLQRAPLLLQSFENASDAFLCFLVGIDTEDPTAKKI